jgi:pectin methylesterase-like acyl-CoA thioesterase
MNITKNIALTCITLLTNLSLSAQLSGTYTIGNEGDFLTISKAVDSLNLKGITSSVKFNIKDGDYPERFSINNFQGESATDTVVFKSESGDATAVKIELSATSPNDNYLLKFNGCERVTFENVSFITSSQNYAILVEVTNGASYNRIDGCLFTTPLTSIEGDSLTVIYDRASGEIENYNEYLNNTITGGWAGLSINGDAGKNQIGTKIIGNEFSGQGNTSLTLINHDYGIIRGNNISGSDKIAVIIQADSTFYFEENFIKSSSGSGVWINNHDFSLVTGIMVIANNMIITPSGSAFKLYNIKGFKFLHNTLYSKNGSTHYTLELSDYDNGTFQNNVIVNEADFGFVNDTNRGSNITYDFNLYYSTTGKFGVNNSGSIDDFATWKEVGGGAEQSSDFKLPVFRNVNTDLRFNCGIASSFEVNNFQAEVPSDIDGIARTNKVWVGASEFRLPDNHIVTLDGYVTDGSGDTIKNTMLELYGDTSAKVQLDFIAVVAANTTNGHYEFSNVAYSKKYWIKVRPNSSLEPNYVEGYHNNELRWDEGLPIVMTDSCSTHSQDIFSRKYGNITPGLGSIKGKVTDNGGTNKTQGTDPIAGLDVILDRIPPTKNTIATTVTDINGDYEFTGLSNGTYVVTIEIEGLPADTIYEVDITNENTVIDLNYCVDSTEAIHGCAPGATGNQEVNFDFGKVYPNPVDDQLIFNPKNKEKYSITITSINGKLVTQKDNLKDVFTLNTSKIKSGIYFIQVKSEMKSNLYKVVKK